MTVIHFLDKDNREKIYGYFRNPSKSTSLLVIAEKIPPGELKTLEQIKELILVKIYSPYENELPKWIRGECVRHNKRCTSPACSLLIQLVGNELNVLMNEVEKLVSYVGAKPLIEEDDVAEVVSKSRQYSIFDLGHFLARKDLGNYLLVLNRLLEAGEDKILILELIFRRLCREDSEDYSYLWSARPLRLHDQCILRSAPTPDS